MKYKVYFTKGNNLGKIKITDGIITAKIKLSNKPPVTDKLEGKFKIIDGKRYYDTIYTRYNALEEAMYTINKVLTKKSETYFIEINLQSWMSDEISQRIIDSELTNAIIITYLKTPSQKSLTA